MVTLNVILTFVGGASLLYRHYDGTRYPSADSDPVEEQSWRDEEAAKVNASLLAEYASDGVAEERRVLFIGSSQTWGAGAESLEDTFVSLIERKLNETSTFPVRCMNGGISAIESGDLLDLYEKYWLDLQPDVVVINLSNNDGDDEVLGRNVDAMIRLSQERSIGVLLVLEPNSSEESND